MNKQTMQFAVVTKNGVVQRVGRSVVLQPKTNYQEKQATKWFDDRKLLKRNRQ